MPELHSFESKRPRLRVAGPGRLEVEADVGHQQAALRALRRPVGASRVDFALEPAPERLAAAKAGEMRLVGRYGISANGERFLVRPTAYNEEHASRRLLLPGPCGTPQGGGCQKRRGSYSMASNRESRTLQ